MSKPLFPAEAGTNRTDTRPSVLAWSAWRRVAAVLPAVAMLWLAVWWASQDVLPL